MSHETPLPSDTHLPDRLTQVTTLNLTSDDLTTSHRLLDRRFAGPEALSPAEHQKFTNLV
jgi:hypothetical protein